MLLILPGSPHSRTQKPNIARHRRRRKLCRCGRMKANVTNGRRGHFQTWAEVTWRSQAKESPGWRDARSTSGTWRMTTDGLHLHHHRWPGDSRVVVPSDIQRIVIDAGIPHDRSRRSRSRRGGGCHLNEARGCKDHPQLLLGTLPLHRPPAGGPSESIGHRGLRIRPELPWHHEARRQRLRRRRQRPKLQFLRPLLLLLLAAAGNQLLCFIIAFARLSPFVLVWGLGALGAHLVLMSELPLQGCNLRIADAYDGLKACVVNFSEHLGFQRCFSVLSLIDRSFGVCLFNAELRINFQQS